MLARLQFGSQPRAEDKKSLRVIRRALCNPRFLLATNDRAPEVIMRRDGQGVMSGAVKAHLDQSTGGPMEVCGKEIRTRGKLIRVAFLDGEGYQFLEDLEATLTAIRGSKFGV